jgi:hypothetical protein
VRLSEVTDWEGGGRTELGQLQRIFERELATGDRRVWMVARQVGRGRGRLSEGWGRRGGVLGRAHGRRQRQEFPCYVAW